MTENPIVEEMKFKVTVNSNADLQKMEHLKKLAEERCPAAYCLSKPIKLTTELLNV